MSIQNINAVTDWCHHFIGLQVSAGDVCIDATAGNGHDTELLCRLVGKKGKVYAFDIQEKALEATYHRLKTFSLENRVTLIHGGHECMSDYIEKDIFGQVSCVVFNLGYLPGAAHDCCTRLDTTLKALETALCLLQKRGMISLCIYSGGDTGFAEREGILKWIRNLDHKKYLVIVSTYYNRPNHPPLPVVIYKL
ncbi:MAG: class I SAM-dependent methyltransferase [Lachnospiraceae bacterium]|nr:class I SAM-dependent methyltransferase [Lachnospiraceae bacterium]